MSTTATMDERVNLKLEADNPGIQLANLRQQKGYTVDYVANKLHLRVHVIELIEAGDFNLLPQPVFIKGYLRAYSKLLGVSPESYLNTYNKYFDTSKKTERVALWQSKKESHKAEYVIRWITFVFAVGVLVAVAVWWHKNRENHQIVPIQEATVELVPDQTHSEEDIQLTEASKVQSLLQVTPEMSPLEKQGG